MNTFTLETALVVAETSLAKGDELGLPPMSVSVLDARGVARAVVTQDGASLMRPDIATAKAWAALAMGRPSRDLAALADMQPALVSGFLSISHGRMAPAAGGLLITAADGSVLGAVGVSGALPEQDEDCAQAGLAAAGLAAIGSSARVAHDHDSERDT